MTPPEEPTPSAGVSGDGTQSDPNIARALEPSATEHSGARDLARADYHAASAPVPFESRPAPSRTRQARSDGHLIRLWLFGKSQNSQAAYLRDVGDFVRFLLESAGRIKPSNNGIENSSAAGQPHPIGAAIYMVDGEVLADDAPARAAADVGRSFLQLVTLDHLQRWATHCQQRGDAASTRSRKASALKSLFTFGHRSGYFDVNPGAPLKPPKHKDRLSERILTENEVHRLLAHADGLAYEARLGRSVYVARRNALLVRLAYASGGRVSELCALTWKDIVDRPGAAERGADDAQLTLFGKGDKTRHVLVGASTAELLVGHREFEVAVGAGEPDHPVLRSSRRGANGEPSPIGRKQAWRIVRALAEGARIRKAVGPHFFRHAHASHALDRGAAPHLVQHTLGHADLRTTSLYAHVRPSESSSKYLSI